jgi:hypothetical protein
VGVIGNSEIKFRVIYELRKEFYVALKQKNSWLPEFSASLGTFCFHQWAGYRTAFPEVADDFLKLSRSIFPGLKVQGGFLFRFMGFLFGPVCAIKMKDWMNTMAVT